MERSELRKIAMAWIHHHEEVFQSVGAEILNLLDENTRVIEELCWAKEKVLAAGEKTYGYMRSNASKRRRLEAVEEWADEHTNADGDTILGARRDFERALAGENRSPLGHEPGCDCLEDQLCRAAATDTEARDDDR